MQPPNQSSYQPQSQYQRSNESLPRIRDLVGDCIDLNIPPPPSMPRPRMRGDPEPLGPEDFVQPNATGRRRRHRSTTSPEGDEGDDGLENFPESSRLGFGGEKKSSGEKDKSSSKRSKK